MSKNNNNNESRLVKLLVASKLWKIITKNSKVPLDGWNNNNKNNNSNNHGVCVVSTTWLLGRNNIPGDPDAPISVLF